MLKVILADDEIRICRLIRMLVDWDSLGMEVVATASNGLEALNMVQQYRPDILVTDIRMPGMSGLTLVEHAKSMLPELEIVIISGYAHFDYAQTAIRFGVSDYLLKPIQQKELVETLRNLGERCIKRSSTASEVEKMRQTSERNQKHLHDVLISDLLAAPSREASKMSASFMQSRYLFSVQEGYLQVFIISFDYDPQILPSQSISIIQKNAEILLRKKLGGLCCEMAVSFRAFRAYGILNFPPKKKDEVRRALRSCLNHLIGQRMLYGNIDFSAALGICVERPEDLNLSCASAEDAIAERLVEGEGQVFELDLRGSRENTRLRSSALLGKYQAMIDHVKETESVRDADAAVHFLSIAITSVPHVHGREIINLVCSAARAFWVQLSISNGEEDMDAFIQECEQCRDTAELFEKLKELQHTWLKRMIEQRKNDSTRPIRMAKQYVLEHYAESITLEEICEITGFSVSYFSALFKRETGEGFAKYLTRVRIDRAKELLKETNQPISEICRMVGYNDLKHFTQTFKKITDLSPSQFRKLYG